jgi:ABC-type multidrug transport system ATPase subunit
VDILGEGGFDPQRFKGRVGALPQDAELPPRHTPLELLTHLARLQGMRSEAARREAERVLLAVRLADRLNQPMLSLSHGMRRRVAVASALVGSPELVLLDEPMAGLDPVQARSLRDVLRACGGQQTLVVSSHDLDELERLCDWVVMIDRGRCVQQGAMEQVTGQGVRTTWTIGPGEVPMVSLREALPGHGLELKIGELEHQAPVDADLDATMLRIMRMLCDAGIAVREVRRGRRLEDQFVDVTRG